MNRLDEPIFMAGPKPMRTEFDIHQRLESCVRVAKELSYPSNKAAFFNYVRNIGPFFTPYPTVFGVRNRLTPSLCTHGVCNRLTHPVTPF